MDVNEAITNLEKTIAVLDKVSNDEKNYNTDFGYMLQQMAFEMQRSMSNLKEINYLYL